MEQLLVSNHISKHYGAKLALNDVSFQIMPGRIVGLLGPNGSGKTTLIKIINSLISPSSGEIYINGNKPGVESKKVVSYLPDKTYLNEWMTVEGLIKMYADFYENFNPERAYDLLSRLNIDPKMSLKKLSKGNQEKVQLILVMSRKADLYVLDEPIAGVDPAARDYILETIISNYDRNASILISTHLISDIENILDDALFLREGQIVLYDSTDNLRTTHQKSIDALFREVFRC
ncbi:MAG: ABC transporter ATP-binding protein [Lachnospiraceae bacterium]|nr:ABC transporter ATP-binding protein [Lachnospiraceae bacterium]